MIGINFLVTQIREGVNERKRESEKKEERAMERVKEKRNSAVRKAPRFVKINCISFPCP